MKPGKKITFGKPARIDSLELQLGIRLLALIIDMLIIKHLIMPLVLMLTVALSGWQPESMFGFVDFHVLTLATYWFYFALLEGFLGCSFGKLFVRLRIYNLNGTRLSIPKAIIRFPLKLLSVITVLGIFMIDLNKKKQGLHDLICGTIVRRI